MQKGVENINKFTSVMLDVKNEALAQIVDAEAISELEELKIAYLGRNGKLTKLIKKIKNLSANEKKQAGGLINEIKSTILDALATQKNTLKESARVWFDASIPGKKPKIGHLHLVTQAIREISSTFEKIGFVRVRYPEVEWDWYAFGSLNFSKWHPARDEWETFIVDINPHPKYGPMALTPHTSSGQVREMMRAKKPPIRMLNIAKNYRRQSDISHVPMFHQFEGLVIDKGISVVHLKGTLDYFARNFFGKDRKTRLRPYNFPFTEPSFEVDISCGVCKGKGCKLCKEGWLELGGAGMVHPTVLKNGKIDPNKYTGFAFGWGVERTYMMKAGLEIGDIRLLYSTDLKFLRQF
jgi:phenylalanyl-tRNA synthetase alpha chain